MRNIVNGWLDWLARSLKWVGFLAIYLIDTGILTLATAMVKRPGVANRSIGVMLIYSALLLALITWRYQKQLSQNNPRHFGRTRFTSKTITQLIGFFLLMLVIQFAWNLLINTHVLSDPANQTALNTQVLQLPFWNLAYSILFAPVIEELIFRGIFLNYFFRGNSRTLNFLGVFMSGLIFGYLHTMSLTPTLLMYAALGWVLGAAYLHFRDIRYNTTLHFLNNAMSLMAFM
ncbi:metal-dependent membrane protease [Levilactobacillus koreensis JCM 16448]|uniref:CPBP family intramembrane glutamic endopeptidase n=1 Tax=Levilactobacillus koreensis TaxID=637971 RepID=UPI0006EF4D7E|nr:type II CAAX endopeptidase family protein [Levilactobacillus koreensis]KRK86044.1 metal-dependent membrane protease [Levilactobacillus koreensis JCM 16448]